MCSWATEDLTHPQPPVLPPRHRSAPRDEPGGGYISCVSSNTPEGPAGGLGLSIRSAGAPVRAFICNRQ